MSTVFKLFGLAIVLSIFFGCSAMYGQQSQGNVLVINNSELSLSGDGTISELDSLTAEFNKWCFDKNEYVVNYKVIRHWWGHDNTEFLTLTEVKTWEDILKFNARNNELFEEHWDTKEKRDAFNDAYSKYFTGKHSDEIYTEISTGN